MKLLQDTRDIENAHAAEIASESRSKFGSPEIRLSRGSGFSTRLRL